MIRSPGRMVEPSMIFRRSTIPTTKTGQVVFVRGVHAGHLRRFSADQGAPGLLAAVDDPFDDFRLYLQVQPAPRPG